MNRITKTITLSVAALATIGSTMELASAGDRYWRRHHVVRPWNQRVIVGGIAAGIVAGAVVTARPRVIYREEPVIVDQAPIYGDDDIVYADPESDDIRVYRDDAPDAVEYAAPRYQEGEEQVYDEDRVVGTENNYFPNRPEPAIERKKSTTDRKKATIIEQPKKNSEGTKEADASGLKPWTKEWKDWCASRFPSFNPQNGTYKGYDQKRHFCKAG